MSVGQGRFDRNLPLNPTDVSEIVLDEALNAAAAYSVFLNYVQSDQIPPSIAPAVEASDDSHTQRVVAEWREVNADVISGLTEAAAMLRDVHARAGLSYQELWPFVVRCRELRDSLARSLADS